MERFFKKTNGVIIQAHKYHDLKDLATRFVECDANGNELKKKSKPKAKKKGDK